MSQIRVRIRGALLSGGGLVIAGVTLLLLATIVITTKSEGTPIPVPTQGNCAGVTYNANQAPPGSQFFGPAIPEFASAEEAQALWLDTVCHDPMYGSVVAQLWNLRNLPDENSRYSFMRVLNGSQPERDRLFADVKARLAGAKVEKAEESGPYSTLFAAGTGEDWHIYQTAVVRPRTVLRQTLSDGSVWEWAYHCHFQPVKSVEGFGLNIPTTPPPGTPPRQEKCPEGVNPCGTPWSGPEQQPVQDNDPALVAGTPGYTPGSAESTVAQQPVSSSNYSPTNKGTNSGCGSCAPAGTGSGPSGSSTGTSGGTGSSSSSTTSGSTSSGNPGKPA